MNSRFSWHSEKIELRSIASAGEGFFTLTRISKGEIVIVQGGRVRTVYDIDCDPDKEFSYHAFQLRDEFYICPVSVNGEVVLDGIFKVNHSCSPNCGFLDAITLVSMRDIEVGEEITFDYAMTDREIDGELPWHAMPCVCRSPDCRRLIRVGDWSIPELQKKYSGYFSPHVAEAIARGGGGTLLP